MCNKCSKPVLDGKGHVIGRLVNDIMLNGQGKNVGRYNTSSNRTLDGQGKNVGAGNQTIKQLGK
jgi:hypothetical protein